MPTYANVTGQLTYPDSDQPLYARISAHPQVAGELLALDDRTTLGPAVATTDATTGDFTLPIPQPSGDPALWRIVVKPLRSERSIEPYSLGVFSITADITLQALVPTAIQAVNPTVITSLVAIAEQAETAQAAAEIARDEAETARLAAEALVLSDLGTTDGQTRALIENPASQTATALAGLVGQLPAPSGDDDTAAINAMLNAVRVFGGGVLRAAPGAEYIISAPLVIGSRTTLDTTGASVTLTDGSECHMIRNHSWATAKTVMDAAISVDGSVVKVTSPNATFTSGDVGTPILLWRAAPDGDNLATTITSVTSGVATVAATAAKVTAVTQVCIGVRDVEVKVKGGVWDRGNNNSSAPTTGNSLNFRRLDGLEICDLKVKADSGKYAICPADVTDYKIHNIDFDTTSDGVHVNGPAHRGMIENIHGTTLDDTVSITPNDWVVGNDVYGDVTALFIDNIDSTTDNTVLKILGGSAAAGGYSATKARYITARNIGGRTTSLSMNVPAGVCLGNDPGEPGTNGGAIEDIVVENVTTKVPDGTALIRINPLSAKRITIDGFQYDSATNPVAPIYIDPDSGSISAVTIKSARIGSLPIDGLVHIVQAATVGRLIVEDVDIESWNGGDTRGVIVNEGSIGTLKVRGLSIAGGTGGNIVAANGPVQRTLLSGFNLLTTSEQCALMWVNTATACPDLVISDIFSEVTGGTVGLMLYHAAAKVSRASFTNVHFKPGRLAISHNSAQTMDLIQGSNVTITGGAQALGQCNTTTTYELNAFHASGVSSILYVQPNANITFRGGSGVYFNDQAFGLEGTAHQIRCTSPMLPVVIGQVNNRSVGDTAYNIDGGAACGVGPVGWTGTVWKNLITGATT